MAKRLTLLLLAATTLACAGKSPKERYIDALNQRMAGDSKAYFDGMLALAHDEPDSRAGRRARAHRMTRTAAPSCTIVACARYRPSGLCVALTPPTRSDPRRTPGAGPS